MRMRREGVGRGRAALALLAADGIHEGARHAADIDAFVLEELLVLGAYEGQVLNASTWPFDLSIVGRVFASVGAPLAVYLLKLAFGVGGVL